MVDILIYENIALDRNYLEKGLQQITSGPHTASKKWIFWLFSHGAHQAPFRFHAHRDNFNNLYGCSSVEEAAPNSPGVSIKQVARKQPVQDPGDCIKDLAGKQPIILCRFT